MRAFSIGGGNVVIKGEGISNKHIYEHKTMKEILKYCKKTNISLLEYVRKHEDKNIDDYFKDV
jgi:L-serine dehydratase